MERLGQKLQIMNFIYTFQGSIEVLTPQMQAIFTASRAVKKSDKFRKILELVLAFGNYLNSSRRGPAYGFKLQSLETVQLIIRLRVFCCCTVFVVGPSETFVLFPYSCWISSPLIAKPLSCIISSKLSVTSFQPFCISTMNSSSLTRRQKVLHISSMVFVLLLVYFIRCFFTCSE